MSIVVPDQVRENSRSEVYYLHICFALGKWIMCCICTPVYFLSVFQKFQDIEESHIVHMKDIIQSYTQSVDETHVQIGEVSLHTHTHTHTHTHSKKPHADTHTHTA
jgi:hypothetical protein